MVINNHEVRRKGRKYATRASVTRSKAKEEKGFLAEQAI